MQTALIILALAVLITAVDFVYDIVRSPIEISAQRLRFDSLAPFWGWLKKK